MKSFLWLCFLIGLGLTGRAQDTVVYTLEQCIDLAIKNNPDYLTAGIQVDRSKLKVVQNSSAILPTVNAYANQGISTGKSINPYTNTFINQEVNTGQYGISAGLNLFSGLNAFNSVMQSRYTYLADLQDEKQALIDLKSKVSAAYFQVLNAWEQLKQARSQVTVSTAQFQRLSVLMENQSAPPLQYYDCKGQMAGDKIYEVVCVTQYRNSVIFLSQILNVTLPETIKFKEVDGNSNVGAELDVVGLSSPMIKSAEYRVKGTSKGLNGARGLIFPSLSLNGNLGSNYSSAAFLQNVSGYTNVETMDYVSFNGITSNVIQRQYTFTNEPISFNNQLRNNLNTYIGLSLQIPLFNSFRTRTIIENSKLDKEQANIQLQASKNKYTALISQFKNEINSARERVFLFQEQVKDYQTSFDIVKIRYETGAVSTYDYAFAKNNLDKAQANLISARYDYMYRLYVISLYK